jgi:hypothetical protein
MRHALILGALGWIAACGSDAEPTPETPATPQSSDRDAKASSAATQKAPPSSTDRALAFVTAPGADGAAEVDWALTAMAIDLGRVDDARSLRNTPKDAELPAGAERFDDVMRDLNAADYTKRAERTKARFVDAWNGDHACKAEPLAPASVGDLPADIVGMLPEPLQRAAKTISGGSALVVVCASSATELVLGDRGELILLALPHQSTGDAENLFVGHMGQPTE